MNWDAKKSRRYHTPACGRATTSRCRCVCGGARHGELLIGEPDDLIQAFKAALQRECPLVKKSDSEEKAYVMRNGLGQAE